MTDTTDIVNRALQVIGTRTNVTAQELIDESSNEAKQANLILEQTRDSLIRMAPWNCVVATMNLDYITSSPGTPENTSAQTEIWMPGQPAPPWAYEYQYPVDCLRALWVVPSWNTGFSGGVPITTAVTGGAPAFWNGPPVKFKVATDTFAPVTAATVVAGGTGYVVGDIITLPYGPVDEAPIGAPVKLRVVTAPAGVVATVSIVNQIQGSATPLGGSYFERQTGTIAQDETDGVGSGATFTLTFGTKGQQRVILTQQELATLSYCKQIIDPNVMDDMFQDAWVTVLGAGMCMALTGNKDIANRLVQLANNAIVEARKADGNEGLTVNDVLPDWIRVRGIASDWNQWGANYNFEWGALWPGY